jgi:hypothetical protein
VFVPKQPNYMLMFVAPLCLVGAFLLARLPRPWWWLLTASIVVVATVLTLLQQASVRVFTANSRAAVAFARANPGLPLFATANAARAATFANLVEPRRGRVRIGSMQELASAPPNAERVVILDSQTWGWASREPIRTLQDVPSCWQREGVLPPRADGAGVGLAAAGGTALSSVPGMGSVAARLRSLSTPAPAFVFRLLPGCAATPRP